MVAILVCWAVAAILGGAYGLLLRSMRAGGEKEEEGAAVVNAELHGIMLEAYHRINPNSRGIFSRDLLNLSTAIQKLEAGEGVPAGVCVYLLEKVGAGDLAEKAKGAGV